MITFIFGIVVGSLITWLVFRKDNRAMILNPDMTDKDVENLQAQIVNPVNPLDEIEI